MNQSFNNLSLRFNERRLYIFVACCLLSNSYISDSFVFVNYICLSIISLIIYENNRNHIQDKLVDVLSILMFWISIKIPLIFPLAVILVEKNKSITNEENSIYFNILISVSLLVYLSENIEILSKIASYGIYFWGLGYVIIGSSFAILLKKYTKICMIVLCFLVSAHSIFFRDKLPVYYFSENSNNKFESKIVNLLSKDIVIIDANTAPEVISNSKIIVPFNAIRSFNKINNHKSIKNCNIFMFGEHDNLQKFANASVFFNFDSYKRKAPWSVYAPLMSRNFKSASINDDIYCSNIGSTLKNIYNPLPLVWSYDSYGFPILLAAKYTVDGNYFTVFGDSDPVVSFLMPYNYNFLRYLFFEESDLLYMNLILIGVMILFIRNKSFTFFVFLFFLIVYLSIRDFNNIIYADIYIKYDDKILSPHYPHHFSSLTAELIKKNIVVTHEQNSKRQMDIVIISRPTTNFKISLDVKKKIVFLMPGGSVYIDGIKYSCGESPLGKAKMTLSSSVLYVEDAYNIIDKPMVLLGSVVLVASGSPQRNVELIKNIFDENI